MLFYLLGTHTGEGEREEGKGKEEKGGEGREGREEEVLRRECSKGWEMPMYMVQFSVPQLR